LFNGLTDLLYVLNHNCSRTIPLRSIGWFRTCWKKATASSYAAVPSRTVTISKPYRFCMRLFEIRLYWIGERSAVRSCVRSKTSTRSMSFGNGFAVTKLPSIRRHLANDAARASSTNARSFWNSLDLWSVSWNEPNWALISSSVQSWMPAGRKPFCPSVVYHN
jgi:hypothetical protein